MAKGKRYIRLADGWYARIGKWELYDDVYDYFTDYFAGGYAIEAIGELFIITKDWEHYGLDEILELTESAKSERQKIGIIRRLFRDAIIIVGTFAWGQYIYFKNYKVLDEAKRRGLL